MAFDYTLDFKTLDFRKHPELYDVGKGEQGVLLVEPYKSELLPHWAFKTEAIAKDSAKKILQLFNGYKRKKDFVGMDMARKFLQMGFTRARRYANHASGRKYAHDSTGKKRIRRQSKDWATNEKALAAKIFYVAYEKAKADKTYRNLAAHHLELRLRLSSDAEAARGKQKKPSRNAIVKSILRFAKENS